MEPIAIKLHLTAGTFQIYCKTFWMVIRFFETVVSCSSLICHNAYMNFKYITNNKITAIKSSYSTSSILKNKKKTVRKFILVVRFYLKCSNFRNFELHYVYFFKDFDHKWIAATGYKSVLERHTSLD